MTEVLNEWQCYYCDSPKEAFRGLDSKFYALVGRMLGASVAQRYTLQDSMWLPPE